MTESAPHRNLLSTSGAGPAATLLPADPAAAKLIESSPDNLVAVVAAHPASSLGWAVLAEQSLDLGTLAADVAAYAYARTGYHRGLDALRRSGWKGAGPIPWEHEPNRGFLRALWALSRAAERIGDHEEQVRCSQFLRDSSEQAYQELVS
ncbi:MAG TPA: DUF3151 domain-containing protein [Propionibacteriaceae bacterium]|nr:DUF3151 domain-containing protein [Propionibacteriaceae bacterium]